ncbi:MAG: nucleotidyltransferase [Candidatus Altiarchaeales archaeon IMC4]|nr:MAG: nucleotidyltransferase [Candidatus Altiarchaeales archaeon IMC4]
MLTSKTILKRVEENRQNIRRYGANRIGLFGSYARDEQQAESDIDLLVEFENGEKTFDNYMELKFFLEGLFNRRVDLVISETIKPSLRPYILGGVRYAT